MSQFVIKPVLKSLLLNPPPFPVWQNTLMYKLFPDRLKNAHTPISLVIYTTKRCNFKCDFCFTYGDLNKPDWKSSELTGETFTKILDSQFGRRALRIGFLGGEPFLNPGLFGFLRDAHARGKITTVVSNASLITEKIREPLLRDYPTMLGLSWYTNNEEQVLALSKWLSGEKKHFWVQTVIAADELDSMREKLHLAKAAGIKNLIFGNYNPVFSGQADKTIFDDNTEYLNLIPELRDVARRLKIAVTFPPTVQRQVNSRHCRMPFSYVHVDAGGDMGACCFRAPAKKYGNIFAEDAWNGPEHLKLRETFLNPQTEILKECRNCEHLKRDLYGF